MTASLESISSWYERNAAAQQRLPADRGKRRPLPLKPTFGGRDLPRRDQSDNRRNESEKETVGRVGNWDDDAGDGWGGGGDFD